MDYFFIKKEIDTSQSSLLNICFGYLLALLPLAFPPLFQPWKLCVCAEEMQEGCMVGTIFCFLHGFLVESPKKLRTWVLMTAMIHGLSKGV